MRNSIKEVMGSRVVLSLIGFILAVAIGCATTAETDHVDMPKRAKALQDLGSAMVMQGDLRGGLGKLLEAHKLEPDNVSLNHQIALTLRDLDQYELSLQYFQRTLELDPKSSEVRNNLGTLYLQMERWDAAITCFKETLSDILYKTPQYAYNNMGYAYYRKGDLDRAIASYQQALKASPSYTLAHANLARAYEARGDLDRAVAEYKEVVSASPKDAASHLRMAKILLSQEKYEEAREQLNLTVWADPESREANEARSLLKGE